MSKHTPGPWFTSRPHGTIYVEARLRGSTLQEVAAVGPTEAPGQQEANARLIAAAPDVLDKAARVTAAFRALGVAEFPRERYAAQHECEAAMLALDATIAPLLGPAQ